MDALIFSGPCLSRASWLALKHSPRPSHLFLPDWASMVLPTFPKRKVGRLPGRNPATSNTLMHDIREKPKERGLTAKLIHKKPRWDPDIKKSGMTTSKKLPFPIPYRSFPQRSTLAVRPIAQATRPATRMLTMATLVGTIFIC